MFEWDCGLDDWSFKTPEMKSCHCQFASRNCLIQFEIFSLLCIISTNKGDVQSFGHFVCYKMLVN